MRHTEVIYLISTTTTPDAIGNQNETSSERQVFANEFYVNSKEFYNAAVAGLKPEKQFEIYSFEYENEKKLKHNNLIYNIIRAETRGDKTRITCERVIGNG